MTTKHAIESSEPPFALIQEMAIISAQTVPTEFDSFVSVLKQRFGDSLDAILLYGSCLHTTDLAEGVADFYVLVNDYHNAYPENYLRFFNRILPPNVFYLEINHQDKIYRSKYAVLTTSHFEKGTSDWFHPYLWARFAQPSRILYARDKIIRQRINAALAQSVVKFLKTTLLAYSENTLNVEAIWTNGLMLTYAAELRTEKQTRAHKLTQLSLDEYTRLTAAALPALQDIMEKSESQDSYHIHPTQFTNNLTRFQWWLRRWQGRILSILRLGKATLTFRDCADYAAWKIERHTGVRIEVTPMLRRHPILLGYKIIWKLFRRGIVR